MPSPFSITTPFALPDEVVNAGGLDSEWLAVCNALQGHVSQSLEQKFTCLRRRPLQYRPLDLECNEYLAQDNFGNLYVCFVATLIDEERHLVPTRVGSHQKGLVRRFQMFQMFDDDLLAHLQSEAFVLFGRQTVAIMKSRAAANQPVLIEEVKSVPLLAPPEAIPATPEPQIALTDAPVAAPVENPQIFV